MTKDIILEKFSLRFREKAEDLQLDEEDWTIDQLLDKLDAFITREEKLNVKLNKPEPRPNNSANQKSKTQSDGNPKSKEKDKGKPTPKCIYCKVEGSHYSNECSVIPGVKQRIEFLKEADRCLQCAMKGHKVSDCKRNRKCYIFKETGHHSSICQKPNSAKTHNVYANFEASCNFYTN
uniref:CCHC-type domain-containing protein n=1 Tax=Caenorhabditis japonica TaxID=281687 RepID=A0A8R1E7J2_CAEJA